ncbi:hypothetical protein BDV98DRAFT_429653 [Pterulicium gracile]|uniref:Uncharacterized protein n=1 Tax=Pterulicium gracile TaxID=1884261 RepID=A0A5C3QNU7_9AGAR|nr:hypothetical protein BDV98DRAFT_429653 [Pterula gracilis]
MKDRFITSISGLVRSAAQRVQVGAGWRARSNSNGEFLRITKSREACEWRLAPMPSTIGLPPRTLQAPNFAASTVREFKSTTALCFIITTCVYSNGEGRKQGQRRRSNYIHRKNGMGRQCSATTKRESSRLTCRCCNLQGQVSMCDTKSVGDVNDI